MGEARDRTSGLLADVRRHWLFAAAVFVLFPAVMIAVALTTPHVYRATARVYIAEQPVAEAVTGVAVESRNIATEAQIASLASLEDRAKARVPAPAATRDGAKVTVTVNTTANATDASSILSIAADSTDPSYARALATAAAEEFVKFRRELEIGQVRDARTEVAGRLRELESNGSGNSALSVELRRRLQQLDELIILRGSPARLLEAAGADEQISPDLTRSVALGVIGGIVLAIIGSALLGRFDQRVHGVEEALREVGLPALAHVPRRRSAKAGQKTPVLTAPGGPEAEALRELRTHLKIALSSHGFPGCVFTSSHAGEGKSFTAANLALSAAAAGDRVVLVDLDLRRPSLHQYVQLPDARGITDVLIGDADIEEVLVELDIRRRGATSGQLWFLPAGRPLANPGDMIASATLATEVRRLATDKNALLLIDSPPLGVVNDATSIANFVGGTVLVIDLRSARRRELHNMSRLLQAGQHHTLGAVVIGGRGRRTYYDQIDYRAAEKPGWPDYDEGATSRPRARSRFLKGSGALLRR